MYKCNIQLVVVAESVVKSCGGDQPELAADFEETFKKQLSNYETMLRAAQKRAANKQQKEQLANMRAYNDVNSDVSATASSQNSTAAAPIDGDDQDGEVL